MAAAGGSTAYYAKQRAAGWQQRLPLTGTPGQRQSSYQATPRAHEYLGTGKGYKVSPHYGGKFARVASSSAKTPAGKAAAKRYNQGVTNMNRYQFQQNTLARRADAGIASKSQLKRLSKLNRITSRYSKALTNMRSKIA
jgi:hypothetical protein